ncbi:hypothetical protein FACS189450_10800 [Spirochaetia bacterium]|nr:hypothetical protein FACS189450_10800 [Spirochaetia bacterium]
MDKDIYELFADNNKRSDIKMNNIIKDISEEEWNKQFSFYWKSIHELCSHIYIGDYGWLNIFRTFTKSKDDEYFNKKYNWGELIFENKEEYLRKRNELDDKIIEYINEIGNNDLIKIMEIDNYDGTKVKMKLGTYIMHMFLHSIHHKSQISLYLDTIVKVNDFTILFNEE